MSEKLLFFFKEGKNKIGRIDAEEEQNIVLGGLGILKEHAIIFREISQLQLSEKEISTSTSTTTTTTSNTQARREEKNLLPEELIKKNRSKTLDKITINPINLSKVFVNGQPVRENQPIELKHCDRVIFGVSNVFRVNIKQLLLLLIIIIIPLPLLPISNQ
jgi:hypothetical protein